MNIFFRVDASSIIGTGHVIRCLTLAKKLNSSGFKCRFICRPQKGDLTKMITKNDFEVIKLKPLKFLDKSNWLGVDILTDAFETIALIKKYRVDWVIVDHYSINSFWEKEIYSVSKKIMIIDDLANRKHECDVLLDQNYHGLKTPFRYDNYTPKRCKKLLGPNYAIIGDEYIKAAQVNTIRKSTIHNILIFMGGSDPNDVTGKVISSLRADDFSNINIDLVTGVNYPKVKDLKKIVKNMKNLKLHYNLPSLIHLMQNTDLLVSGGGSINLQRMILGIPGIIIAIAQNQFETSNALMNSGYVNFLGSDAEVNQEIIYKAVKKILLNSSKNLEQSNRMKQLIDLDFMDKINQHFC